MAKCDRCGKEFKSDEEIFTAIGLHQCKQCNEDFHGTIGLDLFVEKMLKEKQVT